MRICLASQFGEGLWLAHRMAQEGHDVSAIVREEHYAEALGGLVTVMPGSEVYAAEKYDCVVFDATGMGKDADEAREQVPTIGDSVLADKLEEDRLYALDFMTRCGLQVRPICCGWRGKRSGRAAVRRSRSRNCKSTARANCLRWVSSPIS